MKSQNRKHKPMDWKLIASIDVNTFANELKSNVNHEMINDIAANIALCSVGEEFKTDSVDQNFLKVFKLSQILIEYLLSQLKQMKNVERDTNDHRNLSQENQKLRKLLQIHQKAMTYSGREHNSDHIQCPHCPKAFYDITFLKSHIERRHPSNTLDAEGMFALTRKIDHYQSFIFGNNKSFDEMRAEMSDLKEQLKKTELDLLLEKEARMKLQDRIEIDVSERVKAIQDMITDEIQRRQYNENEDDRGNGRDSDDNVKIQEFDDRNSSDNDSDDDNDIPVSKRWKNKITEGMALQTQEMVKLGTNIQKLVSHFTQNAVSHQTNSREESFTQKTHIKTPIVSKPQRPTHLEVKKIDDRKVQSHDNGTIHSVKKVMSDYHIDNDIIRDEIIETINEKLKSFGINQNAKGITKNEYINAKELLKMEKKLLIEQNRHDYDYLAIERQIKDDIEKCVSMKRSKDMIKTKNRETLIHSQIKQRQSFTELEDSAINNEETSSSGYIPVDAIVHIHSSPKSQTSNLTAKNDSFKPINDKNDTEIINTQSKSETTETIPPKPKSVLISALRKTDSTDNILGNEKPKKKIRFNDQRFEYEISPNNSSPDVDDDDVVDDDDDTSEEIQELDLNHFVENENSHLHFSDNTTIVKPPIPAERARTKTDSHSTINTQFKDDYDSDDDLMNELLHKEPNAEMINQNTSKMNESANSKLTDKSATQTKVQELADMIQAQLTKRSLSNVKPPAGSVNIVTNKKDTPSASSVSGVKKVNIDSDSDDLSSY